MPTPSVMRLLRQPQCQLNGDFCIAQEHRDHAHNAVGVGMPTPSTARHPKSELDALLLHRELGDRADDDSGTWIKDRDWPAMADDGPRKTS